MCRYKQTCRKPDKWLKILAVCFTGWFLAAAEILASEEPGLLSVPFCDHPPVIDGQVESGEWTVALTDQNLCYLGPTAQPAGFATRLMLTRDQNYLYVAFQIDRPDDHQWVLRPGSHDDMSRIVEDSVELWLSSRDATAAAQIMMGHGGWILAKHLQQENWNPGLQYAGSQDERQWTGELAIALKDVAAFDDPTSPDKPRLNLALTFYPHTIEGERQYFTWAPLQKMFNEPARFFSLDFPAEPVVIHIRAPAAVHDGHADAQYELAWGDQKISAASAKITVSDGQRILLEKQYDMQQAAVAPRQATSRAQLLLNEPLPPPDRATAVVTTTELSLAGATVYRRTIGAMLEPKYDFVLTPNPSRNRMLVGLRLRQGVTWADDFSVQARMVRRNSDGTTEIVASHSWTGPVTFPLDWPIPDLKPGPHTVTILALDSSGNHVAQVDKTYELPNVDFDFLHGWQENIDKIPSPFFAIDVKQDEQSLIVNVVGRQYRFTPQSLLPVQVIALDQPLFSAPAVVQLDGQPAGEVQWTLVRHSNIEAIIEGRAASGDNHLTMRLSITFDGLIRADLSLIPSADQPWPVRSLDLIFHWETASTSYLAHTMGERGDRQTYYGRSPDDTTQWPFRRWFWLGDLDRGLGLVFEGRGNWSNRPDTRPITLSSHDNGIRRLDVWLIDRPVRLTQPRTITFGLMATPAKPLSPGWTMHNMANGGGGHLSSLAEQLKRKPIEFWADSQFIHTFVIQSWAPYHYGKSGLQDIFSYDFNQQTYRQTFTEFAAGGYVAVPWMQFESNDLKPAYDYYLSEWMRQPPRIFDPTGRGKMFWTTPSGGWAAALGKTILEYIDHFDIGGVYFDTGMPSPSVNQLWDEGYTDESGRLQPTLPIFATHRFKMNLFLAASRKKTDFRIISLVNGTILPPMVSFDQAVLSGEEWNAAFTGDYTQLADLQSRDHLAVKYNSPLWGVEHILLPSRGEWNQTQRDQILSQPQVVNTYLLYALTSGCPTWVAYVDYAYFHQRAKPVQQFLADHHATFWPFWKVRSPDAVLAAAYASEGELLVILGNRSQQPVTITISKLGWPEPIHQLIHASEIWIEVETSQPVPDEIQLPSGDFRLVRLTAVHKKGTP